MTKPCLLPSSIILSMILAASAQAQTLTVQDGLQLWLKADAGVSADAEGFVTGWADQTTHANDAFQLNSFLSPKLVPNGVNSKPVLRFDGTDDYLEIVDSDSLSIAGDLTTFFVVKFTDFSNYRCVWAKTAGNLPGAVDFYTLPSSGQPRVFLGNGQAGDGNNGFVNGSSALRANTWITAGFGVSDTVVTHFLGSQSNGGGAINANIADADTSVLIGTRGDFFTKMKGDIAEIVIYDRALTEAERESVTDYLGQKYNIQNLPPSVTLTAAPAGPVLAAGDTVTLTAAPSDPDGTIAKVQFYVNGTLLATAIAPPYVVQATIDTAGSYSFSAKATDDRDGTADSAPAVRTVAAGTEPILDVMAGLSLWMKADAGVSKDAGDVVTSWTDQSPNHNDATPLDESTAPTLVAAGGPNGKPVLRFDGADDSLTVVDSDSLSFDGDITSFFVMKMEDFDTYRAVWAKTSVNFPASVDYYLLPGSGVPRFFRGSGNGTDLRSIDGGPLRAGVFELAGFSSEGNTMSQYLNGLSNGSSSGVVGKTDLDNALTIGTREDGVTRMKGDLAEILIYKSALNPADRRKVEKYLAGKYAVPLTTALNTPPTVVLTAPAAGTSFPVSADVPLTATAADADGAIVRVEFLVNGSIAATVVTAPYEASVNFPLAGSPLISVRAYDNLGSVTTSPAVAITLSSTVVSDLPDLANLKLWLKADQGITQTAGSISEWKDQSGNINNAVQPMAEFQPTLIASELNGKPVVRFDGVDDDLAAASSPSLANTGDISSFFVVRFDDFDTYRTVWAKSDSNLPRSTDWYVQPGTALPLLYRGGSGGIQSVLSQTALTGGEFAAVGFDMGGTAVHHFLNGGLAGVGEITSLLQDTGRPLYIGRRDDSVTRMKGDVAEIIIYNSALSDEDRAKVFSYLGKKYGIDVVNAVTGFPPLSISTSGNNVTVTWPQDSTGFLLESSETMEEGLWLEVFGVTGNTVTEPLTKRNFYRLRREPIVLGQ